MAQPFYLVAYAHVMRISDRVALETAVRQTFGVDLDVRSTTWTECSGKSWAYRSEKEKRAMIIELAKRHKAVTGNVLSGCEKEVANIPEPPLMGFYEGKLLSLLCKRTIAQLNYLRRHGTAPYEYEIGGIRSDGRGGRYDFQAKLILWAIAELVAWTKPSVALMTDYPDMAAAGDWSGVRDTDWKKLTFIFEQHVVPILSGVKSKK